MKAFIKKALSEINSLLAKKISALTLFLSFLSIIILRVFEEKFLANTAAPIQDILIEYLHNFFFFSITFAFIWLILSLILKKNPREFSGVILWAFFLVLLPPILDMIKTGGEVYWSFYLLNGLSGLWKQFITVFGNLPSGIVYFGSKIVFLLAILLVIAVILIRSKNLLKAILGGFLTYLVLFFMGSFPSWVTLAFYFFTGTGRVKDVNEINVAQFFGKPYPIFGLEINTLKYAFAYNLESMFYLLLLALLLVLFFVSAKEKCLAMAKNARLPQLIYHAGLFSAGLGVGYLAYPANLTLNFFSLLALPILVASIWLAWLASVVFNDIYDHKIDAISNPDRPLEKGVFETKEYWELGIIFFILSIIGGLVIGFKFAALLIIYQVIAWVYSAEPYRLKKFPLAATGASAAASIIVFFLGFTLFSGDQNLHGLSWRIILLLFIALTLSLPIKDFKDIAGDKKYQIWTLPVIFGEEKGKLIAAIGIFISFMLSVFFLNEFRLFWWALLFGAAAFLVVTNKKIKPRQLFWWVLPIVAVYALVLAKIVFLDHFKF